MSTSQALLDKRRRLSLAVRSMLIVLLLAFAFVFFRGISGPAGISLSSDGVDGGEKGALRESLSWGETGLRRIKGQRVWVTRLSESQITEASKTEPFVFMAENSCTANQEFCSLEAATSQSGIELSFTEQPPAQLPSQTPWYGGFVNPINGAVYDRLGRAYRLGEQAPSALEIIDLNE